MGACARGRTCTGSQEILTHAVSSLFSLSFLAKFCYERAPRKREEGSKCMVVCPKDKEKKAGKFLALQNGGGKLRGPAGGAGKRQGRGEQTEKQSAVRLKISLCYFTGSKGRHQQMVGVAGRVWGRNSLHRVSINVASFFAPSPPPCAPSPLLNMFSLLLKQIRLLSRNVSFPLLQPISNGFIRPKNVFPRVPCYPSNVCFFTLLLISRRKKLLFFSNKFLFTHIPGVYLPRNTLLTCHRLSGYIWQRFYMTIVAAIPDVCDDVSG